jgi:purine-binding chemotaxis protein CheW
VAKDLRLITFRLGSETFVMDIMAVRQIIPYAGATSVPTAPEFVEGIIVVRNEVIPLIDLRDRLYPGFTERTSLPLVMITHSPAGVIGLKVDEVRRIVTVAADAILPPPPLIRGIRSELLIGVVPHGEEVFLLLDLEALLSVDERRELQSSELSSGAAAGRSGR